MRVCRVSSRTTASWAALLLCSVPASAAAQAAVVTGRVTGEQGQPIPAANVYITELNVSVGTNESGVYSISIAAPRVGGQAVQLRVRSVGYAPQSRPLTITAGTQTADFVLRADITRLSEVVVTGVTGATERAKVPFTVARVDSSSMPVVGVNPLTQLQGKVPGTTISSVSGRPGATPSVILRGPTSIDASGRGQEPLYIVDGVVLQGTNPLTDINPADIESVEIVKGAAAASLYGSRAGAGVIQITTRRGGTGDGLQFNVRQEYGLSDVERDFGLARNHAWLTDESGHRFCVQDPYVPGSNRVCARTVDYHAEAARINDAPGDFALQTVAFPLDPGSVTAGPILRRAFIANQWSGTTYNAVQQIVRPKPLSITDVSVAGRTGGTSVFGSLNYARQGGALLGLEGYERVGARVNAGQRIGEHWDVQLTSFFSRGTDDGFNQENSGTGFFRLTRAPAIVDITRRDTLGRLYIRPNLGAGGIQNENPLYSFEEIERNDVRYRYLGGANVKFSPNDWLEIAGNAAIDRLNWNFRQFQNRGFRATNGTSAAPNGLIFSGVTNSQSINSSLQGTVRAEPLRDLNARFNVRALYEEQGFDNRTLQGSTLRVSDVDNPQIATAQQQIAGGRNTTRQMSVSGGVFLDYRDRYTADLLARRDGSSRFGPEERWQTYGRASAAWLASREAWWPVDLVSQFTLRGSVGSAGNTPSFAAQYETYTIGGGGALSAATLGNAALRPEVVVEREIGAEMEILERVGFSASYSHSDARDQILLVPVAVATGFPQQWQNAGTLRNRTLELSLGAPIVRRDDFEWSGRLNYTRNRAMVTRLDVPPFGLNTGATNTASMLRVEQGTPFGTIYGRRYVTACGQLPAGFQAQCGGAGAAYQRNDEGYVVWVGEGNHPGMGITDNLWNTGLPLGDGPWGSEANFGMPIVVRDETGAASAGPIGNVLPDFRLGLTQNVGWGRLSAYALLDGSFGQDIYNQGRHWAYLDFLHRDVDQAGRSVEQAKPIGYYYRANSTDNASGVGGFYDVLQPTQRFVEDASYVKLREVSVSYRLGRVLGGGGDWSVSVIGRNLKTWTDYTGFDPEVGLPNGATNNTGTGSGVLNGVDSFTFPNLRSVSFVLSSTF